MLLCAFGRRPLRAGFLGSAASFAGFSCTSFSFTGFSFAGFSFAGFSSAGAASFFALVLLVIGFLAGFAGFSSAGFSSSFSSATKASFSVFFFGVLAVLVFFGFTSFSDASSCFGAFVFSFLQVPFSLLALS